MNNKELSLIDLLSIASFVIALQNLDLNIGQDDMDKQTSDLMEGLEKALNDIHGHLAVQDTKLSIILNKLEELYGNT